ncbi:MAG TPA: L-threonylcarbamoyladenylate synthase [Anaerolineales bacterium]|nr:L-threonylcarbamoyladenylate synthase [Anaerolineales bacterium]
MITQRLAADAPDAMQRAFETLEAGGVVAFPTDTVYGLGAPAFNAASIERLFAIKGRELTKAIAVLIAEPGELDKVAKGLNQRAMRLAERFWPGPLTLVLPRHPSLPALLSPNETIGVRVPDHAVARALLAAAGPMAVTSANLAGGANPRSAEEVLGQLGGRIELVLDGGQTPGNQPSTVVDLTGAQPRVLRAGPISEEEIRAAL